MARFRHARAAIYVGFVLGGRLNVYHTWKLLPHKAIASGDLMISLGETRRNTRKTLERLRAAADHDVSG
jgi:hypothetical protein